MALVGHANANRHALLNTRKLHVYSTCMLCQQTHSQPPRGGTGPMQQMRVGRRAGFQRLKTGTFG
jgi:hypothetical protein